MPHVVWGSCSKTRSSGLGAESEPVHGCAWAISPGAEGHLCLVQGMVVTTCLLSHHQRATVKLPSHLLRSFLLLHLGRVLVLTRGGFLAHARALDSFILPGLKCQLRSPFLGNSLHFSSSRQRHISVKYAYVASTHKMLSHFSRVGLCATP